MELKIDETQQQHIYTSLKEGETAFKRARKTAEHLGLPLAQIDEQIDVNKKLRRIFNPKAEEEAWAKKRGKGKKGIEAENPNQLDIEKDAKVERPVAKEGVEVMNPESTDILSDDRLTALIVRAQEIVGAAGFAIVSIEHVRAFTSSTRESLQRWAQAVVVAHNKGGTIPKPSKALKTAVLNVMREVRNG